jgi:hypothetical protein
MAAGLGYKEFSTGDVLTAADANGYLASQVVMVFASAAARTSAIASPQEGMISYLKDTNSTEYYSGSAWAAIGGGASGGMTLLSTTNLSGASTVISIVGGYKNLQIYVKDFYSSSAADVTMRINADSTASNYHQLVARAAGSIQTYVSNAVDGFDVAGYQTGTSQQDNFAQVTIYDYDQAATKKTVLASGGVINGASTKTTFLNTGNYYGTVAAVTGVTFVTNAGTFSAGTVEIYGVK